MALFQEQQELRSNNLLSYENALLQPDPLQQNGKSKTQQYFKSLRKQSYD